MPGSVDYATLDVEGVGEDLFRELEIFEQIGEGAMGTIHRASFRGALVAVKRPRALRADILDLSVHAARAASRQRDCGRDVDGTLSDDEAEARHTAIEELKREIQLLRTLPRCSNVVALLGGSSGGGSRGEVLEPWCALELMPRGTLEDLIEASSAAGLGSRGAGGTMLASARHFIGSVLRRARGSRENLKAAGDTAAGGSGEGLSRAQACRLGAHVAAGLAHCHAHLVCHRDVKPANIGLAADGRAVLLDFGAARPCAPPSENGGGAVAAAAASRRRVAGGQRYTAPELALGHAYGTPVDVYSLAHVLWHALAKRAPYAELGEAVWEARVCIGRERPPVPPAWPAPLAYALRRAWDPQTLVRPAAARLATELAAVATALEARPNSPSPPPASVANGPDAGGGVTDAPIVLDSPEGQQLLSATTVRAHYDGLRPAFAAAASAVRRLQRRSSECRTSLFLHEDCGIASAALVCASLGREPASQGKVLGAQTPPPGGQLVRSQRGEGFTLDELARLMTNLGFHVRTVRTAADAPAAERAAAAGALADALAAPESRVIANYERLVAGQSGPLGGHHSPLAAAMGDKFLLLDVWRAPPGAAASGSAGTSWLSARALFAAMATVDSASGQPRGFLVLTPTSISQPKA